jgi:hypothetical protein
MNGFGSSRDLVAVWKTRSLSVVKDVPTIGCLSAPFIVKVIRDP